ncbi:MAG TPA: tripartite tricarboxylate transporter substrate-binding protein [Beijerinckiaceae bacterium]|jgi:tripartite-type tricarboxylate transporter receptor subunit TctC
MSKRALLSIVGVLSISAPAAASPLADFYKSQGLTIVVGFVVGGGYDVYSRALSRHWGKHLPGNPTIVVRNMPGAGSMAAANYIYTSAPKDGSHIATFSRSIPTQPLFDPQGVQFDALKLNWIGSPASEVSVVFAQGGKGFKTVDDLRARPMVVPASGLGADSAVYPFVVNALLGTKMKVVTGYRGSGDFMLAIERDEAEGMGGSSISTLRSTRPAWLKEKSIDVLLQLALRKHPDFPDVPLVTDLAANADDRQVMQLIFSRQEIAFPFAAPPGVPEDRLKALRDSFQATLKDPGLIAEAEKLGLEISPVTGEETLKILQEAYSASPELLKRARAAVTPPPAL